MTTCTIPEAREQLSGLIDRALRGEPVVITDNGHPLVELKPICAGRDSASGGRAPRRITAADLEWLQARRLKLAPGAEDAVTVVRKMRDEDEL